MQKFLFVLICFLIAQANLATAQHTYGPIETGDSLWKIASKVAPPSVKRHQVIVALHRANPHAFRISCNMNTLKIGVTLQIPSLTEIQAMTNKQAREEIERQAKEWEDRSNTRINCPPVSEFTQMLSGKNELDQSNDSNKSEVPSTSTQSKPVEPTIAPSDEPKTPVEQASQSSPQIENLSASSTDVALVSDKSTISSPTSSIMIVLFTLSGFIIALLIVWFYRQKKEPAILEQELPTSYGFSEPFNEMPLSSDKSEKNTIT